MASPEPCISGRPMKVVLSFRTETRARPFFTKKRRLLRRLKRELERVGADFTDSGSFLARWRDRSGNGELGWGDGTVLGTPWGRVQVRFPPGPRTGELCAPGDALGLLWCRSRNWPWSGGVSIENLNSRNIQNEQECIPLNLYLIIFVSLNILKLLFLQYFYENILNIRYMMSKCMSIKTFIFMKIF